jgi:hypothetical protein
MAMFNYNSSFADGSKGSRVDLRGIVRYILDID